MPMHLNIPVTERWSQKISARFRCLIHGDGVTRLMGMCNTVKHSVNITLRYRVFILSSKHSMRTSGDTVKALFLLTLTSYSPVMPLPSKTQALQKRVPVSVMLAV